MLTESEIESAAKLNRPSKLCFSIRQIKTDFVQNLVRTQQEIFWDGMGDNEMRTKHRESRLRWVHRFWKQFSRFWIFDILNVK